MSVNVAHAQTVCTRLFLPPPPPPPKASLGSRVNEGVLYKGVVQPKRKEAWLICVEEKRVGRGEYCTMHNIITRNTTPRSRLWPIEGLCLICASCYTKELRPRCSLGVDGAYYPIGSGLIKKTWGGLEHATFSFVPMYFLSIGPS
jgi:hypothetical protein